MLRCLIEHFIASSALCEVNIANFDTTFCDPLVAIDQTLNYYLNKAFEVLKKLGDSMSAGSNHFEPF